MASTAPYLESSSHLNRITETLEKSPGISDRRLIDLLYGITDDDANEVLYRLDSGSSKRVRNILVANPHLVIDF